ncbi:MAG: TIGR00296 family protein [Candidatus Korarchaeota archaeon]|nr:TIGR00296 family protein [Candidatus Korarchaeota archaeon]
MAEFSMEEGEYLVRLARKSIEHYMERRSILEVDPHYSKLKSPYGAFVTLNIYPEGNLRGCIGYPEPILPLYRAVIRAAIAAAFEDPRFPPLAKEELDRVTVEVSILTPPERIDDKVESRLDLRRLVIVGKHGLIVRRGLYSGLLLPQVAVEYSWDSEEFLSQTCIKAGMWVDCWLKKGTEVYRFTAEIFEEEEPRGRIIRREIG